MTPWKYITKNFLGNNGSKRFNLFQRQMSLGNFEVTRGPPFSLTCLNGVLTPEREVRHWLLASLGLGHMSCLSVVCYQIG